MPRPGLGHHLANHKLPWSPCSCVLWGLDWTSAPSCLILHGSVGSSCLGFVPPDSGQTRNLLSRPCHSMLHPESQFSASRHITPRTKSNHQRLLIAPTSFHLHSTSAELECLVTSILESICKKMAPWISARPSNLIDFQSSSRF